MSLNPLLHEYERKKRAYHNAGRACKGTPEGSPERAAYAQAKADYHEVGARLRASRAR